MKRSIDMKRAHLLVENLLLTGEGHRVVIGDGLVALLRIAEAYLGGSSNFGMSSVPEIAVLSARGQGKAVDSVRIFPAAPTRSAADRWWVDASMSTFWPKSLDDAARMLVTWSEAAVWGNDP